jgi:hypothetical protein
LELAVVYSFSITGRHSIVKCLPWILRDFGGQLGVARAGDDPRQAPLPEHFGSVNPVGLGHGPDLQIAQSEFKSNLLPNLHLKHGVGVGCVAHIKSIAHPVGNVKPYRYSISVGSMTT